MDEILRKGTVLISPGRVHPFPPNHSQLFLFSTNAENAEERGKTIGMRDERSDGRAEETGRNGRWKIHRGWKPAADHLVDRLTRRVSVFEGPDCEKCIVLSREIGVVKYAALELSRAKRTRSWLERERERQHGRREREG